jgi:hypothetical protein
VTSAYRRDHQGTVKNDEWNLIGSTSQARIVAAYDTLIALYPLGAAPSSGERMAFLRAGARLLIDSGKAGANGGLA